MTVATTLNSSDKNAGLTLSGGNLTVEKTDATNAWQVVRSVDGLTSGRYYVEITNSVYPLPSGAEPINVGISNATQTIANGNPVGNSLDSAGWFFRNQAYFLNGAASAANTAGEVGVGQICGYYVDLDNKFVGIRNVSVGTRLMTLVQDLNTLHAGPFMFAIGLSKQTAKVVANFGATGNHTSTIVSPDFGHGWYEGASPTLPPCQWSDILNFRNTISGTRRNVVTNDTTIPNGSAQRTHATENKTSGKWYFEIVCTHEVSASRTGIGVCAPCLALNINAASDAKGTAYFSSGQVYVGTVGLVATISTWTDGDTISVAVDLDNNRIWYRKNAGNWNNDASANPATNTNGYDISSIRASGYTYGPSWSCMPGTGNAGVGTANFGRTAFAQSIPSGFSRLAPLDPLPVNPGRITMTGIRRAAFH